MHLPRDSGLMVIYHCSAGGGGGGGVKATRETDDPVTMPKYPDPSLHVVIL